MMMRYLLNAALSMVIQRYVESTKPEEAESKLQRLQRVLLRIDAVVEEAVGRHITNEATLRQLELLKQGMYGGHYMLDTFRCNRDHCRVVAASSRRPSFPDNNDDEDNQQSTKLDAGSVRKLVKALHGLETLLGEMQEFAVRLGRCPRICRQLYSTYLFLDKAMFGRQMEKETVLDFLLRPEAAGGDENNPGVLPIVGKKWVGKSTLVEHVCLDERVRGHFRFIAFFSSDDIDNNGVIDINKQHQDRSTTTGWQGGRSLAVIELTGDIEEETWRRLYSSAASTMARGSKIIITSRSEKIAALGTTQALMLKFLPRDAFWYFFKALVFGSADPGDQPKLTSVAMEISTLLNNVFLRANVMARLLRTNQNGRFWCRVLQCLRDYTNKHVSTFGDHPSDLVSKSRPVYAWSTVRSQNVAVKVCEIYQKPSPYHGQDPDHGPPMLGIQEFLTGCVVNHGKFDMLLWRSSLPPYYAYAASCVSEPVKCSVANKKRPRHERDI